MAKTVLMLYLPFVLIAILYVIVAIKIKSQKTLVRQSAYTRKQYLKRDKCADDVRCHRVSVRSMLAASYHIFVSFVFFHRIWPWHSPVTFFNSGFRPFSVPFKQCFKPFHLFYLQLKLLPGSQESYELLFVLIEGLYVNLLSSIIQ